MAVTADERTSVFGNFLVVTGSYNASGGTIDLSGQFSEVLSLTAHADGTIAVGDEVRCSVVPATNVATIADAGGSTVTGRWMAIGRR